MKPFKTYDEQIEIMRLHNLLPPTNESAPKLAHHPDVFSISNKSNKKLTSVDLDKIRAYCISNSDDYIKEILQTYGYYNIVNQYNKPFLNKDDTYKPYIDFYKLYSLQQIDAAIKNAIFYPILQVEQKLKTCIAYEFAKAYGPFENTDMTNYIEPYFDENNYNKSIPKKERSPKYISMINQLKEKYNKCSTYEPFKHYKEKHHHIPIWIFINQLTYGDLFCFYELLQIQNRISHQFNLTASQLKQIMFFLKQVRNDCAHFSSFLNQKYPDISTNIPLLNDFKNEFKFTTSHSIPNIFRLLISLKYLLPNDSYYDLLLTVENDIFHCIFKQYIPQISEYIKKELSLKTSDDYKHKLDFLKSYTIKTKL